MKVIGFSYISPITLISYFNYDIFSLKVVSDYTKSIDYHVSNKDKRIKVVIFYNLDYHKYDDFYSKYKKIYNNLNKYKDEKILFIVLGYSKILDNLNTIDDIVDIVEKSENKTTYKRDTLYIKDQLNRIILDYYNINI